MIHIPDVSEWQTNVDFSLVGPAVIVRAHNGYRADNAFHARLNATRAHQVVRGFYGYVAASRDAATQGAEFAAIVGRLQPGEFAVCDLEEGLGDQSDRAMAWMKVVDSACGGSSWLYSGEAFDMAHLTRVVGHREWIAAYQSAEPTAVPHTLWQHTSSAQHPGISGAVDCSIFNGTVEQFRGLLTPPVRPVQPPIPGEPAWYTRPLSRGMRGEDVRWARHNMHFGSTADWFDDWFNAQVRKFQHDRGMTVDGVIGPLTARSIG